MLLTNNELFQKIKGIHNFFLFLGLHDAKHLPPKQIHWKLKQTQPQPQILIRINIILYHTFNILMEISLNLWNPYDSHILFWKSKHIIQNYVFQNHIALQLEFKKQFIYNNYYTTIP